MKAPVETETRGTRAHAFLRNWLAGAEESRGLRRRVLAVLAVLRMAHRTLGMGRKRLGLGALGVGGNGVRAAAIVGLCVAAAAVPAGEAFAYDAGAGANADNNEDTAVGNSANADGAAGGPYAVAIGFSAEGSGGGTYNLQRTDGLGFPDASLSYRGTAVGGSAVANDGGAAFGSRSEASGLLAVAVGGDATATATSSAAFGPAAFATASHSLAMGFQNAATGVRSTAIGPVSTATGEGSTAIGLSASASGEHALALGSSPSDSVVQDTTTNTEASGANAIAFGTSAKALANDSIAMGRDASGTGDFSAAIGFGADASGESSVAIGADATASGAQSIAIGAGNTVSGDGSGAIGDPTTITGSGSYSLGNDNTIAAADAGVFGNDNTLTAAADGSRIIGNNNNVDVADAFLMGNGADATVPGGVALGSGSVADTAAGVAGYDPTTGQASTDITATWLSTESAVSVGDPATGTTRQITGVAAGSEDTDAVNVAQLQASETHYFSVNDDGVTGGNFANDGATGVNALAAGVDASAAGERTIALGGATAGGDGAIAMGADANAPDNLNIAIGENAQALGSATRSTVAIGHDSSVVGSSVAGVAVGDEATVGSASGVALGGRTTASGTNAVTVGYLSTASGANSVAMGILASATHDNSVALGDGAATSAAAPTAGVTIDGDTYTFAGDSPVGTVSVGDAGAGQTRQIQNVAAGRVSGSSTDAINGSQLFATNQAIEGLGDTPLTFAGNAGTPVDRLLGETINLTGGNVTAGAYSGDNIRTVANGADGIAIQMAESPDFGGVVVNEAGTGVIAGVSDGVDPDDAVNVSQLDAVDTTANAGWDISAEGANATNVAPGETVDLSNTDGNIEVAKTAASDDVTFDLADNITADSVTLGDTVLDTTGLSFTTGGPSITAGGIDAGGTVIANVAPGAAGTDAVNVNQLEALGGTPLTFAGNAGTPVDRLLGETFNITGGNVTAGAYSGDNIRTVANGADGIEIQMAESPDFGGVVVNEGGTGIISGVSDGVDPGDAVNVSQLDAVNASATAGWDISAQGANATNVAPGETVDLNNADGNIEVSKTAASDDVTFDLADDITLDSATLGDTVLDTSGLSFTTGGPSITAGGIDAGGTVVSSVAPGAAGTDAVNVNQLEAVETTANTGWNVQANGDAATNVAPGDTVQFLDGQNIEVTRAGTDITLATAADLTADSLTLTGGQVFDSAGLDMNGTAITNLAPGTAGTDAVNLDQLQDAQTRYYSVNDGGTPGGNFNNNGATGLNALAAGVDATASADSGVAVGEGAQADIQDSVALGAGAISDRAIAPVTGTLPGGLVEFNTTDQTLLGAVSVGDDTAGNETYRQITNVADGTQAQDAVTIRQLQNSIGAVSTTPTEYFHANSMAADSLAVGQESIAVGPTTVVNADNGIGMGNGAIVDATAPGGTAIGQDAQVQSADGIAMGTESVAGGEQSVALGAGAESNHAGSVALGSNSATQAAVGTDSTTINDTTYDFAGDTPVGTVSVGDAGTERTVTNVAAGRISDTSTDAVNGSQLFAANSAIEDLESDVGTLDDTAVQYDTDAGGDKLNSVTLEGGDPNAPVVISNVAEGVDDTDAVNVAQLEDGLETTLADANAYTDQQFAQLNNSLGEVRQEARQAAALGMAAASLRYDDRPGKLSVAAGGGTWRGEGAFAVGMGYTSDNQRIRTNISGTSAGGEWGAGAGLSITLN